MAIKRICHHTFTVSDLDKSITFYRDLLGFRLTQDKMRENLPSYDKVMCLTDVKVRVALFMDPADESMLALLQYHNPKPIVRAMSNAYVGTSILAVQVEDIDWEYDRLTKANVCFNSPPVDMVREGKLAARLAYALDPDGIVVELYQPTTESIRK